MSSDQTQPEAVAEDDLDTARGGIKDGVVRAAQRPVGYKGVSFQQGRVLTDADLNEESDPFASTAGGSPNV